MDQGQVAIMKKSAVLPTSEPLEEVNHKYNETPDKKKSNQDEADQDGEGPIQQDQESKPMETNEFMPMLKSNNQSRLQKGTNFPTLFPKKEPSVSSAQGSRGQGSGGEQDSKLIESEAADTFQAFGDKTTLKDDFDQGVDHQQPEEKESKEA